MAETAEAPGPEVPEPDISHLVTEDDAPVDNVFSERQQRLLTESLYASWVDGEGKPRRFAAFANVGLFFAVHEDPLVPDVMLSLGVRVPDEMWDQRHRSYLVWEYGKCPDLVIEVVSGLKGGEDTRKLEEYARIGVPYYVVHDPQRLLSSRPLRVFELHARSYVELLDPGQVLPLLGLSLTLWEGEYEGCYCEWLRWRDEEGRLLLTGSEKATREACRAEEAERRAEEAQRRAEEAQRRAEEAQRRAEEERARAERLVARLRELGLEG